jgi:predicted DNA-binding protein
MLTDWLRRVAGHEGAGVADASGAASTGTAGQSQRLARLGLAAGGAVSGQRDARTDRDAHDSIGRPRESADLPAAAPQPQLRRDFGLRRTLESRAQPTEAERKPAVEKQEPKASPQPQTPAARNSGASHERPGPHYKRGTYRLPLSLLRRLRAASKQTGRFQYQIVADALRAHLPKLESEDDPAAALAACDRQGGQPPAGFAAAR